MLESGSFARLLTVDGWVVLVYQFGPPLVRAILLALGTWFAARLARSSFNFAARRADAHARLLIGRIINIVVVGLGVSTILDTLGVPLTTFVTVLGVAGLGISLAMQDVLKSFVAGTFLLFERPFRIGDEISVKDQRGVVENIPILWIISRRRRISTNSLDGNCSAIAATTASSFIPQPRQYFCSIPFLALQFGQSIIPPISFTDTYDVR